MKIYENNNYFRLIVMLRAIHKICIFFFDLIKYSLDTTISRTITINVPMIPAYTDLRTLLYEITENGFCVINIFNRIGLKTF